MQAQRNYQNQQGGTSMAGLLGRPRVPPAEAFRAFQESEGLPPVKGATPREDDRTPTPEPPDDEEPETPPQDGRVTTSNAAASFGSALAVLARAQTDGARIRSAETNTQRSASRSEAAPGS